MGVRIPIYTVRLVREGIATYGAAQFDEPKVAAAFFHRLIGSADREHLAALFLDAQCKPCGATIIGIGTLTQAKVHAREVFKAAILASADSILLAHNHPGGLPVPSAGDLQATRTLVWAGRRLGIEVKDHIIVVPSGEFVSMHESGFLGGGASDTA